MAPMQLLGTSLVAYGTNERGLAQPRRYQIRKYPNSAKNFHIFLFR
jgi:hypothetical protein